MSDWKRTRCILGIKMKQQLLRPRIIIGYMLGICQVLSVTIRYVRYSAGLGIQMAEPFVLYMNHWAFLTFVMLGYFIIVSDAPFVDSLSANLLIRGKTRRTWTAAMLLYMLIQAVAYWGVLAVSAVIFGFLGKGSLENQWSETLRIFIEVTGDRGMEEYGLVPFSGNIMGVWKPYEAVLIICILGILYVYCMAVLMFALNLKTSHPVGSLAVISVHFYGVLLIKNPVLVPVRYSLLANAILEYHDGSIPGMGIPYSIGIHLVLLALFLLLTKAVSKKCDYRMAVGDRIW